jgi:hypothetical protein
LKKKTLFFLTLILFSACSKPDADITQFKWLEGKWEGTEGNMQTFEEWKPIKENMISGLGGVTSDNDTMFSEIIKIELKGGELYYVAAVPGNPNPVSYKLIKSENNSTTFENLKNDFPQRVIYTLNADGSLYARIEGQRSGKDSKQEFNFTKVK